MSQLASRAHHLVIRFGDITSVVPSPEKIEGHADDIIQPLKLAA